ncbi:hypothetical protein RvY_10218 [Ramazzottius varieornatus]|uniref:Uncharacterized protein n=1 Tax=Ramazzottius varieornatus TaxID=947166 RepID=A0A1D1VGJ5_RAMVA|nr:hypothetical protein RvY_10218 [Ramazzottius varieornatus]
MSSTSPNTFEGKTMLTTRNGIHTAKKLGAVASRIVKGRRSGRDFKASRMLANIFGQKQLRSYADVAVSLIPRATHSVTASA